MRSSVDLPHPDGPQQAHKLAGLHLEVNILHGHKQFRGASVGLDDMLDAEKSSIGLSRECHGIYPYGKSLRGALHSIRKRVSARRYSERQKVRLMNTTVPISARVPARSSA